MEFIKNHRPSDTEILCDVSQLEQTLKVNLPTELKEFLFKAAGTYPEPECFSIQDCPFDDYGICYGFWGGKNDSFKEAFETFINRIPEEFLPIGWTACGDVICYVLWGDDAGSIWLWDHENEVAASVPDRSNCYKCADSLQNFLDGFFEDEEDDDEDEENE